MKITLGFSPCPNDTFMFDALVHQKIDCEGLDFEAIMTDVEELNRLAFAQKLDVTKLSYHALAHLTEHYVAFDAGSALGNNCGPLLIALPGRTEFEPENATVAIPGKFTTANFLLDFAFPKIAEKKEVVFSKVEEAVLSGEADAGVIIHENRFTYEDRGLKKILDLGEHWEAATGLPIPLGGIAGKRSLPPEILQKINRLIRQSVEFAFKNPGSAKEFISAHAQEMNEQVMYSHINLYVNNFSVSLGKTGRSSVSKLFEAVHSKSRANFYIGKIFID